MRPRITLITSLLVICFFTCCDTQPVDERLIEPGVSLALAEFRKSNYERTSYDLYFSIPDSKAELLTGEVEISLLLRKRQPVIIDFRAEESQVLYVKVNKRRANYEIRNEHIILPSTEVPTGESTIQIGFTPDDQSLNRRDEFLYTLLVPDRARTLFPCFDQPDMKSQFTLTLEVPHTWQAVANGRILDTDSLTEEGRKTIRFDETEPLSTYLFSFVAGQLESLPFERDGRKISLYHRETDPDKVAQCPEIARQVFDALDWLEEYTGVLYPFQKYDLIILPGFQYGGMEHTGATLYNDRRMFLNKQPTLNEELGRSSLIAHETAHLWFGDYVTMKWFDDVWTKEVFANYFASRITEQLYPAVNHRLSFMLDYVPPSYSEDRTAGSNPIKQPLDNLNNAGLVYGNIIYDKSPVVLEMLIRRIGEEAFQRGIREYLDTYAYGNATWEDLIRILDQYTGEDLQQWSHIWVNEKGMPTIRTTVEDDSVVFVQSDPWERGITWPQDIQFVRTPETVIPNANGASYGFFQLNEGDAAHWVACLDTCTDEVLRGSLLIMLYENMLNRTIDPQWYLGKMLKYVAKETNPLLFSLALGHIDGCIRLYPAYIPAAEQTLWNISRGTVPQFGLQAFRLYTMAARSPGAVRQLYNVWKQQRPPGDIMLSEADYIRLSYTLAIHLPEQADEITVTQLARIDNPDRRKEYAFVSPSVSPRKAERDSVFQSLLQADNRRIEPWAAAALSNLNHPLRQEEAVRYIRPALDILKEVQRTGDIFFPTAWLRALLSGHTSDDAREKVDDFLEVNPRYPVMLSNKIRQQADFLYRVTVKRERPQIDTWYDPGTLRR